MPQPIRQQAGHHCPFLNRSDERCAGNFSLDRLNHALRHCFGDYASCSTYLELLVERRTRRAAAAAAGVSGGSGGGPTDAPGGGGKVQVQLFVRGRPAGGERVATAP